MTVVGLVVIALAIIGVAVLTSNPVQKAMSPTEVTATETEPSAATDEKTAAAEDEAAATDEASAAGEEETAAAEAEATGDDTAASSDEAAAAEDETAAAADEEGAAAGEEAAADAEGCCKPGDTTPPLELVKLVPPGGLHNPYDWKKLKEEHADDPDYLVKQFRLPGCNECHGGGGGGGFCPALSQGVWFWGNDDDVLFRLISEGSAEIQSKASCATSGAPCTRRCRRWDTPSRRRIICGGSSPSFVRSNRLEPTRQRR
ncbi:MAG: hypothetical protein R3D01_07250 [Hyphomicrobiales bacterium]